jgi:phosphoribosylaminoimidazolecarboxamide formyltransferase/IMP cyclohydrolase
MERNHTMSPNALFSLYDTTNAASYASDLVKLGWNILASAETVAILRQEKIPCEDISTFTGMTADFGFPPTLHSKIEYALTGSDPDTRIDLVYDIPYPLAVGNDVGGRVLLALACKGKRLPVMCQEDMQQVIRTLQENGSVPDELRDTLIDKTNASIASHYLELVINSPRKEYLGMIERCAAPLANGENPYQTAELYSTPTNDPLAMVQFRNYSETKPCFTNLVDVDSLLNSLCLTNEAFKIRFGKQPYLAVASKHGNVCGMSIQWQDPLKCIEQTLFGNPVAVWGGELMTNFPIDESLANILVSHPRRKALLGSAEWMLDVVAAPAYNALALETLLKRKFRKVLENPALLSPNPLLTGNSYRFVRGGFIRQSPPWRVLELEEAEITSPEISTPEVESLILAWAAAFTSFHGGNEVAIAKDGMLLSVGGGPATVQAARVAVERAAEANHDLKNSVFCADAFFPFTDAPDILIEAGVKLGCVPAGGKNEPLVRKDFADHKVEMVYLPEDFRGFCRH